MLFGLLSCLFNKCSKNYDKSLNFNFFLLFIINTKTMSRTKLPKLERKVKIGICLSRETNKFLNAVTNNKSKFIEDLINKHINNNEI